MTVIICTLAVAVGLHLGRMVYKQMNPPREWRGKEVDFAVLDQAMKFLQFKFSTLEKATDCFNEANKLGSGGYGEVFKGTLPDGREIAVKRLYVNGRSRSREIYNEMDVISKAQHRNLAWKHFQSNTITEIIDESLMLSEDQIEEMKREIHLGLLCTQADPSLRPNMSKVLQILRHKDMDMPYPTKPPFLYESLRFSSSSSFHSFHAKSQSNDRNSPGKSQNNDSLRTHDHQDHSNL
ncbi:hypothetical protein V6N13_133057 [Hibiscus sabdariffa]